MLTGKKRLAGLAVLAIALVFGATLANAELVERGNLFIKFSGGIAPTNLPRHTNAPITVRVDGTVRTLSGERPPALRFISIAINRGGRIETKGLPVCRRSEIEAGTSAAAMAACGDALVGTGRYVAGVDFPEQATFPLQGRILAFNTVIDGERAIFAHVYGRDPFPNSRVFVFHIHPSKGTYGTILTAALPKAINRNGYLKRIILNLRRDFVYRGSKHSYLTAACAAPEGFTVGVFPFVKVGMTFEDGRKLASTLIRTCTVRNPSGT
ncbi:MAG: hypothetical protein QOF06_306 [Solirubrobacterales bacterium]|jgi:hypothetical protein|nr:hypothetical protein [Solirubrobacterales bacterium]